MINYYLFVALSIVFFLMLFFKSKAKDLKIKNQGNEIEIHRLEMRIKGLKEDAKAWEEFTKNINSSDRNNLIKRLHEQGAYKQHS